MKKYILGAVFAFGLLASPAFTQAAALTSTQISAIVALLQAFGADQSTINNVEISLNGGTPTGGSTQQWCHNFNTDLTFGSSGDDVSALSQTLSASGVVTSAKTTVFDENTAADVVQFQAKYGIRQTGYVGPITRAKLNALYGCNQTAIITTNTTTVTTTASSVVNAPVLSVSPTSFVAGASFSSSVTGAASNAPIRFFARSPNGVTSEDLPAGTTDSSGQFTRTHITTGRAAGNYQGWVTVDGVQSNIVGFTITAPAITSISACTTSFSPKSIKAGDFATWNFQAGAGDTTFQYSCSGGGTGIVRDDGTTLLSQGQLPLSGSWRIKITAPMDCILDSYNPNVTGSGSQCRDTIYPTFFTITTASLPNASANTSYSTTLATTNTGTMPYQWSWSPAVSGSGVLPTGLTLNPSTGIISGTPTTAGKYDVAIKVTDAAGNAPTKTLTLYVDAQAGASTQCTTSFSPGTAKIGDIITWNFQAGAGDTTFQYSCNSGFTKEDGTTPLGYGTLPLSGSWRIKVPGYGFDCTLDSYNPSVIGSGSQCRATLK